MSSGDFRGVLYGGAADAMSSGDLRDDGRDSDNPPRKKKKRLHRHTPEQIQQLEA